MTFTQFLSFAGSILGVIGLSSLAVGGLLGVRRREIDRVNKEEREALTGAYERLTGEVDRLTQSEQQCQERLSVQAARMDNLTEMVTQAAAVTQLAAQVAEQHGVIMHRLDQLVASVPKRAGDG